MCIIQYLFAHFLTSRHRTNDSVITALNIFACAAASPNSSNFLDFGSIAPMAELFNYLSMNKKKLKNQFCVMREMFTGVTTENPELKCTEALLR
jgi:hypothetical protein